MDAGQPVEGVDVAFHVVNRGNNGEREIGLVARTAVGWGDKAPLRRTSGTTQPWRLCCYQFLDTDQFVNLESLLVQLGAGSGGGGGAARVGEDSSSVRAFRVVSSSPSSSASSADSGSGTGGGDEKQLSKVLEALEVETVNCSRSSFSLGSPATKSEFEDDLCKVLGLERGGLAK